MRKNNKKPTKKERNGKPRLAAVAGGVLLLVLGIFFICTVISGGFFTVSPAKEMINTVIRVVFNVSLLLVAASCLVMGLLLFLQKKIINVVFFASVGFLALAITSEIFAKFNLYQSRLCNDAECPSVTHELVGWFIFGLVVWVGGIFAGYTFNKIAKK